jgi:hypothetical protein
MPPLLTDRLILRPFTVDDAPGDEVEVFRLALG